MTTLELAQSLLSSVRDDAAIADHLRDQLTEAQAQLAAAMVEAASAKAQLADCLARQNSGSSTGAADSSPVDSDQSDDSTGSGTVSGASSPLSLAAQVVGEKILLTASRPAQLVIRTTMKSAVLAAQATTVSAGPVVPGWTYWAQAIDGNTHSPEITIQIAGYAPADQPYDHLWRVGLSSDQTVPADNSAIDADSIPASYAAPTNAIVPKHGDDLQSAANLAKTTGRPLYLNNLFITSKMLTLDRLKDVIIQACKFADIPGGLQVGHAIRILGGCPGLRVINCQFQNTGAEAIMAWGDMSGALIQGNTFCDLFEGIHFPSYTGTGLLVVSNTFTGIRRMAIELQGDGAVNTTVQANTITYSDIKTTYDGTFAISAVNRGTGTIVCDNIITGPSGNRTAGNWGVAIGIEFSGINGRCENNRIAGCNEGIHIVYSRGATITGNTLISTGDMAFWQTGTEDASGARIIGNKLVSVASGILFTGTSSRRQGLLVKDNSGTVRGDWVRGDSSGAIIAGNDIRH